MSPSPTNEDEGKDDSAAQGGEEVGPPKQDASEGAPEAKAEEESGAGGDAAGAPAAEPTDGAPAPPAVQEGEAKNQQAPPAQQPGPYPPPGGQAPPPPPQGYYQPYPPPPQGSEPGTPGTYPHHAPPPPRYDPNAPPPSSYPPGSYAPVPPGYHYMPPPPYGYYHPYPPPPPQGYVYPPPPQGHQPPPGYGYPPTHDPGARYPEPGAAPEPAPYAAAPASRAPAGSHGEAERKPAADRHRADSSAEGGEGDENEEDESGDIVPGAVTARLKTYIKPRTPSTQEVLDRRARKNAQSRARAAKLRQRIVEIEMKPEEERTEEEMHLWSQYEQRRQRKNDRSRERALEKKEEIDRILAKPDKKRTKIEKQFLETALSAKKRKNEGDRLRRQRLKELGLSTKGSGIKPGISARGPLPPQYQHLTAAQMHQHGYGHLVPPGHHMGDIPMSPLPTMPHHHHHMQSPGYGSPGMMPFPSPGQQRGPHGTPGRHPHHGGVPYMPPAHAYEAQPPAQQSPSRGQPQQGSRVEQRRNPDGSTSIQIGAERGAAGGTGGAGAARGEQQVNMSEGMLMDNENEGFGEQGEGGQEGKV